MAAQRPTTALAPEEVLTRLHADLAQDGATKNLQPVELDRELRQRLDAYHMEIFGRTQAETSKRWTYEQEIKRPYYHVTELDDAQITNWGKYLDFEESEGDYARTKFLYERCLVTCANYEEFWYRYARWTMGQMDKPEELRDEEVRSIYNRASCVFVPIVSHSIRLSYARFEESLGKADTAIAIHEAILMQLPGQLETILSLVNTHRRNYGIDAATAVVKEYINNQEIDTSTRGALVAELSRLTFKIQGNVAAARKVFESVRPYYTDSSKFWIEYFNFELSQAVPLEQETVQYKRIKAIFKDIRETARISPEIVKSLSGQYFNYLLDRGDKDSMKEYTELDMQINGPYSVANKVKAKPAPSKKGGSKKKLGNGHAKGQDPNAGHGAATHV